MSSIEKFSKVQAALKDFQAGKMLIIVDDDNRENEGDLVCAAENIQAQDVNFMATHGRGLICLSMEGTMIERLELPLMAKNNEAPFETAFTVSIEAKTGVSTGISAHDRARTIQVAVDPDSTRKDIVVPGHTFPLCAVNGGVLVRAGHTEAAVDLARLSGLKIHAGVICEILNDDGTMARRDDLEIFSKKHQIKILSIAELIEYRLHHDESLIQELASSRLPNKFHKDFQVKVFKSAVDGAEHLALVLGDVNNFQKEETFVRVHSECLTGDVFSSLRCDCGSQLDRALEIIAQKGSGVLLYLRQEGRGIGLVNKIKSYELQENGLDTVEANEALGFSPDLRHYGIGAQILRKIGLNKIIILSNNPKKIIGIGSYGLEIVGREAIHVASCQENADYLKTKKNKMGHLIP